MSPRVEVELQPAVLRWARERSKLDQEELARKIPVKVERVQAWERTGRISLSQVGKLAAKTYTPEGFLFLTSVPEDRLDIPDLRTVDDQPIQPSPNLIETVQAMQRRQAWMHDDAIEQGADSLSFVGSADLVSSVVEVAASMRVTLDLVSGWAGQVSSWVEALRLLRLQMDAAGVLVVSNGVVGNNTRRKLDRDEFGGFALVDSYAPLIFVNAADYKGRQMFTLAHELAHVWLAASGVSNPDLGDLDTPRPLVEQRCNAIAAEFLIPEAELRALWSNVANNDNPYNVIALRFKTSRVVAARRALDLGLISRPSFFEFWEVYQAEEWTAAQPTGDQQGNFWNTQGVRIGRRFSHAVVNAVQDGRLLYQDAYELTGLKGPTFDTLVERIREEA